MLSSSVIKNVGQASHYYSEKDNYYTQEEGFEQSEWWGKGADKLSLSGKVDEKKFTELLQGKLSNGEQLGKIVDGVVKHRSGWDLTFSAPKSVSIMAFIGGDKRLLEAHRDAVKVALLYIERSNSQARIKTPDGMTYQNTGNLVASLYHHDLSRAKDPQMHTHSVIMNMTERKDGKWRSLASSIGNYNEKATGEINGFIERVRHNNRFLSKLYETELAFRVKQLGYDISIDAKTGIFQISDVPKDVIQFFSKRRVQIENQLDEKGLSGGKAAAIATLNTRDDKEEVNREQLKEEWESSAKKLGFDFTKVIENTYSKKTELVIEKNQEPEKKEINAILQAAKSLSTFQTTFTLEEVITEASSYAIGNGLSFDSILNAIEGQIDKGELISLANEQGKTMLMAKSTLDDEKRLSAHIKQNKLLQTTVDTVHLVNYLSQHTEINLDHHKHLESIFGDDRLVLVEGKEAKNSLVEPIIKIAKSANLDVAILSPTLINSKQFANNLKQPPETLWERIKGLFVDATPKHYSVLQFLSQFKDSDLTNHPNPKILIVDNSHLLSTHQKANLAEWNTKHNTKLILLGDSKTILPQQTGASLEQLSDYGIKTISVEATTNKFSSSLTNIDIQDAINKFSNRIVEVKDASDRHLVMAKHYSHLTANDRKNSWIMSRNKDTVEQLNIVTHNELVKNKALSKSIQVNALIPVFVSAEKADQARSYDKNQVVRFNESFPSLSVDKGEYLKVIQNNKKSNRVILQKEDGQRVTWRPDKVGGASGKVELFNEKKREFAIGETVVFHRSNKVQRITRGERFTITAIQQTRMKLKNAAGQSVLIDSAKPYHRHLDYGYAATAHQIAHEKPTFLIAELPSKSFTTDQRQFYQTISQPKEAWIYTDNHQSLIVNLENKTGNRLTVQETLKHAEALKKNLHSLYDILEKQILEVKGGDGKLNLSRVAVEAVEYAMHHLAEREAGFSHKQLMQTAMQHALGEVTQETLTKATLAMEQAGILLRGTRGDGTLWTTADAVKMEREILAICTQDQGKFRQIASDDLITSYCEASELNPEQTAAVKAITQSKNRVLAVQGHAGTGKTHMLATVADVLAAKNLITSQGYEILGLAPTNTAVEELRGRGLPAQTLQSFIASNRIEHGSPAGKKNLILIIDEASMVSNRKMLEGLQIAHQFGYRAIPTGDNRQIQSIEGGKPFDLIQNLSVVETVKLTTIKRQNNPILQKAIKETIEYDFKAAFNTLKKSIIEIPIQKENVNDSNWQEVKLKNRHERVSALVKDYFTFAKSERDNIQVITPGHDDRRLTNTLIRKGLIQEGTLSKEKDVSLPILTAASLTQVERSHITNFSVGDVLRFGKRESSQIKSGDYLTIAEINQDQSIIKLKGNDGREVAWQVPKFDKNRLSRVEVFKKETRDIQVGDKIRWSRSDKEHGFLGSEAAKITGIVKNKVTVELANKTQITLDANDHKFQHWDHGYAATVYAIQGKTKEIILAHLESFRQYLTTQPAFLVALTRSVNVFRLYTDNINNLLKRIEKNSGRKLSSLEVIGEYPDKSKITNQQISETTSQSSEKIKMVSSSSHQKQFKNNLAKFSRYEVQSIKEGLNRDAEKIAVDILGNPKLRGSNFIKFGSNQGSLSVTTKGEKQGWWNDFGGEGGGKNMLSFIQKHLSFTKQEAIQYGAKWLGIYPSSHELNENRTARQTEKDLQKLDKELKQEQKAKIEFAKKLAQQSHTVSGTIVEKYLKEHRAISMKEYPDDIRFHPGIYSKLNGKTYPAMLVIARDKKGEIQAVQATYLDPNTATKIDKSAIRIQKQTFGVMKGAAVTIEGQKGAPTLIVEGTETGLSLAQAALNANVKITLSKSNFVNIEAKSLSEKVILCLDNDGKDLKSDKIITSAIKRLVENNKQVSIMVPKALQDDKQDYNDILKKIGLKPIKTDLKNAISYEHFYGSAIKEISNFSLSSSKVNIINSRQISDKAINNFAHQMTKNASQNNHIQTQLQQSEPTKTISKIKDIDREI